MALHEALLASPHRTLDPEQARTAYISPISPLYLPITLDPEQADFSVAPTPNPNPYP